MTDLYQQLLEAHDTRCEQVPGDPPMSNAELWDLAQRAARNFTRGTPRDGGSAA